MFDVLPTPTAEAPEPELTRDPIPGHRPRSRTTIHGRASILFGVPFLGCGVMVILVALGVIPTDERIGDTKRWVGAAAGALFALGGVAFIAHGTAGLVRQLRVRRERSAGSEHWLVDHAWDPEGIAADSPGLLSPFSFVLVCVTFLAIVLAIRAEMGGSILFTLIAGFLGLLVLVGLGHLGVIVTRRARYGRSQLEFRTFPYYLGEKVDAVFQAPKGLGSFDSLCFRLRCVEEAYVTQGHGDDQRQVVISYQRFLDERVFDAPGDLTSDPFETPLVLPLPDADLETCLRERPPTYWELEVKTTGRGVTYHSVFLLPVYARGPRDPVAQ